MIGILVFVRLLTVVSAGVKVTPLQEVSMMFEHMGKLKVYEDYWTVVTNYEPADVSDLVRMAEDVIIEEKELCRNLVVKKAKRCQIPFDETEAIISLLKRERRALDIFVSHRTKRALDFIGEGLHWAFGVVDARSAQDMMSRIDNVKENEARTFNMLDREVTVLRRSYDKLAGPLEVMNKEVGNLRNFINISVPLLESQLNTATYRLAALEFKLELLERLSRVNANLLEAQGIQQTDLAVMDDLIQGRLHPLIFSADDLERMENNLPLGVKDNWVLGSTIRTLSLARVKIAPNGKGIRVFIKIPLPSETEYMLNAVYSVPVQVSTEWDAVTQLTYEFLAHSTELNRTIGLTNEGLSACVNVAGINNTDVRVCQDPERNSKMEGSSCEEYAFRNVTSKPETCHVWLVPHIPIRVVKLLRGSWLFRFDQEQLLTLTCGRRFEIKRLIGSGVIDLDEGCTMFGNKVNFTQGLSITSSLELLPLQVGVSPALDKMGDMRSILDPINVTLGRLPTAAISEHGTLHKDLVQGKREIEELVSAIGQEKSMRSLEKGQRDLWMTSYSVGGVV